MALKTEKLEEATHLRLSVLQNDINDCVIAVGQLNLQIRDLENEKQRLAELLKETEQKFDQSNKDMNDILSELEKKYPTGEIDLKDGIVTYEENQ